MGQKLLINVVAFIGMLIMWAQGYVAYRMLSHIMKLRENRLCRFLGWLGLSATFSVIIYPDDPVNVTADFLLFLVTNWILFDVDWLRRFSVAMLFYPTIAAVNYLMYDIVGRAIAYFVPVHSMAVENQIFYSLSFAIPLAFWYVYYRTIRKRLGEIGELLDTKSWILLDIVGAASLAAVFGFIYFSPENSLQIVPFMLACIVTNIGSTRLAFYMADSIHADMERKNLRMQQNYYEELEKNQQQIRKLRHDMRNHFAAVGALLQEENYEEAKAYFGKLSGRMDAGQRQFCKNGIVNALLNVKYNEATGLGIDVFFHISIDEMLGIDEISLCTLFANTLDNAIEACAKIEELRERKISVKARYTENGYFCYEIANSKVNAVREKKGKFLTDKEDKKSHGLGLASVRETVEKYNGTMDVSYTEGEFRVVVLIEAE